MKTVVLIPAHNAEKTIAALVGRIAGMGFPVVVVDDGSKDLTYPAAAGAGAVVIKNEKNLGKGAALRRGFGYILSRGGFDAVITMDADGQHDPASLADFVNKAGLSDCGLVVGNRMHSAKGMPLARFLTNRFMSYILSKKLGQKVPDTQCGFRLIKKALLERLSLSASNYEIESEVLVQAGRAGARIESVPIRSIYTGQTSRINPLIDTWRFIRLMMTL